MTMNTDLPNFAEEVRALIGESNALPPIDQWHPERQGEIDIEIDTDGQWLYQGDKMERVAVVQLLSRILLKEGEDYFLVSPVEKQKIKVVDVPFVVRLMDVEGEGSAQKIHLSTNVGDTFTLGSNHPLMMRNRHSGDSVPYARVRGQLDAKLARSVYYELADYAVAGENGDFGVWSDGVFFNLG